MTAANPNNAPRPDDSEVLAAARAEFWMRWRGQLPSYAEARRQPSAPPAAKPNANESPPHLCGPRRKQAESLCARFERCIAKELGRCEVRMTPDEWREHHDWIEQHARGSLWEALARRAAKGEI